MESSPRRRRVVPGKASSGHPGAGVGGHTTAWLQRHPVAAAAVYMLIGGCIVYVFLSGSRASQQQPAQHDGIVRLPAMPAVQAAAAAAPPAPATFRVSQAADQDQVCMDTCFKAKDGICDDGRYLHNMTRGLPSTVLCDLGTDCSDCGPWKGVQHSSAWKEPVGPVEFLRQHNLTVLTKKSAYEPRFHLAYTDPQHDIDASKDFAGFSTLELRLSHIAYHVLHAPCQQGAAVGGSSGPLSDTTSDAPADAADAGGQQRQQQNGGAGQPSPEQQQQQQQSGPAEGLVLDVGAGFGWYSLLAGMLGCRVIAWEPVKIFQAYMEYSIARNRLQHKIELRSAALVAPAGFNTTSTQQILKQQQAPQAQEATRLPQQRRRLLSRQTPQQQPEPAPQLQQPAAGNVSVVAPTRGMWGTASIGGRSIYLSLSQGGAFHKYTVPAETLDAVVLPLLSSSSLSTNTSTKQQQLPRRHSRVALLKVDIEGHEPEALAGAAQLLGGQLVDNVLLEHAPHIAEMHNFSQAVQYPQMLLQLVKAGFSLGHVADMNYLTRPLSTYSEPLHQLQAVTEANLKFDLFDSMQMTEAGLTWLHEPCREMLTYGLISEGIPERLHPKSFRATFEVNTHVWATRQQRYVPYVKGPAVGVFPLQRRLDESWFVEDSSSRSNARGMGGRSCNNLREVAATEKLDDSARAAFLISHRCRCGVEDSAHGSCAEKEQLADACAMAGRTPFREDPHYVPDRR